MGWGGDRLRTSSDVARLVVLGEVAEVEVLEPGDPALVLLVVLVFGPLHCHFKDVWAVCVPDCA